MNVCPLPTRFTRAAALPVALTLAACGGASEEAPTPLPPPLFDDAGQALAAPRAAGAATATREQLRWQERVSSPTMVVFDLDQLGATAALAQAQVAAASKPLPGTVWFVHGGAEPDATHVVEALREQGLGPVFLVR